MKKIRSRILSLIMALVICIALFPENASAVNEDGNIGDAASITNASSTVRTKEVAADFATVTINGTFCQTSARSMLSMINNFRTGSEAWAWNSSDTEKVYYSNLGTLSYDYNLEKVAMQRAAEIALSFSHTRPNGQTCWTAYSERNYGYWSAGENIAAGYTSAAAVFEGWKETNEAYSGQGHRRNMLSSDNTVVGIAGFYYNGYYYWVQEFAYPTASSSYTAPNDSATDMSVSIPTNTATTLSADKTSMEIEKGSTADLPKISAKIRLTNCWPSRDCTVTPTDITWSSANTAIASISGSKVTGVASGTTTLTARNSNGNTATCQVTVTNPT
ncbi:MAG: CAP domain-containing protein, partial [Clostridia bacterium]|nr:CAP domain-containing protein [Clostridia bacterium]